MPAETPPPELVMGCNTPEGLLILADWLDEHGGDGSEFREQMRDIGEMPRDGNGNGSGSGYGRVSGDGRGDGYRFGHGTGYGDGRGDGYGTPDGSGFGFGFGYGFGTEDGDGGPHVTG